MRPTPATRGSTLELTRLLLRLRRAEPALGDGDLDWVSAPGDTCLVLRRPAGDEDPHVLVAMNLGDSPALVSHAGSVIASSRPALQAGAPTVFWLPPGTPPPGCADRRTPGGAQ